jgi:hypothetical protein
MPEHGVGLPQLGVGGGALGAGLLAQCRCFGLGAAVGLALEPDRLAEVAQALFCSARP